MTPREKIAVQLTNVLADELDNFGASDRTIRELIEDATDAIVNVLDLEED